MLRHKSSHTTHDLVLTSLLDQYLRDNMAFQTNIKAKDFKKGNLSIQYFSFAYFMFGDSI